VEPAGHAYPGEQGPLQEDTVSPGVSPYLPAVQAPEQPAVASPVVAPYRPAGHREHTLEPARLYCPAPHKLAVGVLLPAGHAYPAVHGPVQTLRDWPASPNRPALQGPVHEEEVDPLVP
jgi:hypothetical protein